MLVRKYIHQRLQEYYAQPFDKVVGSLQSLLLSRNHYLTSSSRNNSNNIPFRYLFGEYHWKYIYSKLYNNNSGQWLTPSELFSPYYGQCIALWIIQQIQQIQQQVVEYEDKNATTGQRTMNTATANSKVRQRPSSSTKRIEIIELGGGRGTNAIDILDYIYVHYYDTIYQYITSYTIIDSSIPLIQYQNDNIHHHNTTNSNHNHNHTSIFHTEFLDLYTYATTGSCSTTDHQSITHNNKNTIMMSTSTTTKHHHHNNSHNNGTIFNVSDNNNRQQESDTTITIVIGLEILDNLPHDKIRVVTTTKTTSNNNNTNSRSNIVEQVELIQSVDSLQYKEIYVPLNDPIIQNVLQYYPLPINTNQQQQQHYYWIPTIACTIIQKILQERPDTLFLFADFDNFIYELPQQQQHITKNKINTTNNTNNNNNDTTTSISIPVRAIGEPIVTDMNDNDLISYIIPSNTPTDILFPTNFHSLSSYIQSIQSIKYTKNNNVPYEATINSNIRNQTKNVHIYKQYDFLQQYGPQQVIATTSYITGYSPMIHDFENCSILTVGSSMDT